MFNLNVDELFGSFQSLLLPHFNSQTCQYRRHLILQGAAQGRIRKNEPEPIAFCIYNVYTLSIGMPRLKGKAMKLTFKRWGNSLAVRVPNQMTKELGIMDGSRADVRQEGNCLVLTVEKQQPSYTLDELLEKLTSENLHGEHPTGPTMGKEEW